MERTGAWRGMAALGLGLLAACAPTYHTAPRYRFYPPAAERVEAAAELRCRALGEPGGSPVRRFVTDGCSLWPDGWWQECCVEHDMAYWCGGTWAQRKQADERLAECVADRAGAWLGALMELGVRLGAPPWMPAYWRWGYGRDYRAGYPDE